MTGKDGHFLLKRNSFFEACVRVGSVPDLPAIEETFRLKTQRIPLALLRQALAFMEKVYEQFHAEAIVLLTIVDGQWGLHVPEQEVSPASLRYWNSSMQRVVGSIHSHPGFGFVPSSTDEHDEVDFDGIHAVTASFDASPAAMSVWAAVNGRRFRLRPAEVFEGLERTQATFPEEWLAKVSSGSDFASVFGAPRDRSNETEVTGKDEEAIEEAEDLDAFPIIWDREDASPYGKEDFEC